MNKEEIESFLRENKVGVLGTIRKDGRPNLSPVWYIYDERIIKIWLVMGHGNYENLARDNRVTFCVDKPEYPFKEVTISGRAEVTSDDVRETALKIVRHYFEDDEKADKYMKEGLTTRGRAVIHIKSEDIFSWDGAHSLPKV
ncbi:MAG: PPOX class F420-dependent oxidoreductase [Dehalococcoidia bacterium]